MYETYRTQPTKKGKRDSQPQEKEAGKEKRGRRRLHGLEVIGQGPPVAYGRGPMCTRMMDIRLLDEKEEKRAGESRKEEEEEIPGETAGVSLGRWGCTGRKEKLFVFPGPT